MRRAIALTVAALATLAAFTPQPVTPQAKASPASSERTADTAPPPRDTLLTQPARNTRPAVVQLTVQRGDTYGRWAISHCGTFNAWPAIQQANGWPERRIPVGATATIVCNPTPAATPALATTTTPAATPAWVHPLASGKQATSAGLCWGAPRVGHTHKGVDLLQDSGTPIRAVSAGTIALIAYEAAGAGNYVIVAHGGNLFSRYMHLRERSPLSKGDPVKAGQTIGYVGATGNAHGPHLHFEILQGGPTTAHAVNPAVFMRRKGINLGC